MVVQSTSVASQTTPLILYDWSMGNGNVRSAVAECHVVAHGAGDRWLSRLERANASGVIITIWCRMLRERCCCQRFLPIRWQIAQYCSSVAKHRVELCRISRVICFCTCIYVWERLIVNKHWINIRRTSAHSCDCSGNRTVDHNRWCLFNFCWPLYVTLPKCSFPC